MRQFARYLRLQSKRIAKAYIGILALTLVLLCAVGAIGVAMLSERSEDESFIKMKIGLVGDREDEMLNMGLTLLRNTDNSSIMIDFVDCTDEASAVAQMKARELNAYVVIPSGFADALMAGDVMKMRYVMAKSGASMNTQLTREVLDVVSNYFIETQAGAGAFYDYARDKGVKYNERVELNLEISLEYTAAAFDRDKYTEVTEIGLGNNLSTLGYYVCGLTIFFVLTIGIAFCGVRVKTDRSLDRLLYSRGYGAVAQTLGEYLPYFLFVTVTMLIPAIGAGALSEFVKIDIPELKSFVFYDYITLIIGLIPSVFVITAMQYLLYEIISGMINSVLLQFVATVIMGYIGGCFYPLYFMPEAVQKVASVLPSGVAFNRFADVLTNSGEYMSLVVCAVYGVGLIALAAGARKLRIRLSEGA